MFPTFDIVHTTIYRYGQPVTFGRHRIMFRPVSSHDQRVLATNLEVTPFAEIYLVQDVFSNSIAMVTPQGEASELRITCSFTIEHAGTSNLELPIDPGTAEYPFAYSVSDYLDLDGYLRPQYEDSEGQILTWARQFVRHGGSAPAPGSRDLLVSMTQHIKTHFTYHTRHEEGTQSPSETLARGSGTCRDFALLMMEAARRLGFAARFVSGYLYDPALDTGGTGMVGSGSTHAWVDIYLPGAGWVPFDPTNALFGGTNLIRVATARDPRQASPISGSWHGAPESYLGMEVDIKVTRR